MGSGISSRRRSLLPWKRRAFMAADSLVMLWVSSLPVSLVLCSQILVKTVLLDTVWPVIQSSWVPSCNGRCHFMCAMVGMTLGVWVGTSGTGTARAAHVASSRGRPHHDAGPQATPGRVSDTTLPSQNHSDSPYQRVVKSIDHHSGEIEICRQEERPAMQWIPRQPLDLRQASYARSRPSRTSLQASAYA